MHDAGRGLRFLLGPGEDVPSIFYARTRGGSGLYIFYFFNSILFFKVKIHEHWKGPPLIAICLPLAGGSMNGHV